MSSPGSLGIFLSYRREDASGYAGRLHEALVHHFGGPSVFMDIDSIEPGVDYVHAIEDALARCRVLLVLIGPQWLDASDAKGHRRLDQPDDFVQREIAVAFEHDLRVIPLLVRGARMPRTFELPETLALLSRCQAFELSDRMWHESVSSLLEVLMRTLVAAEWYDGEPAHQMTAEPSWLPTGTAVPLPGPLAVVRSGPFAGRDGPMRVLQETWQRAKIEGPLFFAVAGEPGIGKTRLVAEFAAATRTEGATVLAGRCTEEPLRAYEPFADMLVSYGRACQGGTLITRLGELAEPLAPTLPATVAPARRLPRGGVYGATDDRVATFDAFVDLIARLSDACPLLVVLEDLHWATNATLLLLRHVLDAGRVLPVLVVGTYRDTELDRMHPFAATLADLRRDERHGRAVLRGLDESAIAAWVAARQELETNASLARVLLEQTDGNPFFVGELLRDLAANPAAVRLPEGVREVVGWRLAQLPEAVTKALRVGAVIGPTFTLRLLEAIPAAANNPDELLDAVDIATTAHLIVEEPDALGVGYAFAHALVRQTLYEELSSARRARLHDHVVTAIQKVFGDDENWLAALAYHSAESARAGDVPRALEYARRAAQHASNRFAVEEAAAIVRRAVELFDLVPSDGSDAKAELLYMLWVARSWQPDVSEGELRPLAEAALHAARASDNPDRIARGVLAMLVSDWGTGDGDDPEKEDLIQEVLRTIGDRRSVEVVEFLARAGQYYVQVAGRRTDGERFIHDSLQRARELGDRRMLAYALSSALRVCFWRTPQRGDEDVLMRELRETCVGTEDPVLKFQFHLAAARHALTHAAPDVRTVARRLEEVSPAHLERFLVQVFRGCIALLDGDFAAAETCNAVAVAASHGRESTAVAVTQLFMLRHEQGRLEEIVPIAEQVLQTVPGLVGFRSALALARLELGKTDGIAEEVARLAADDFAAVPRDMTWSVSLMVFAELSARLDDRSLARQTLAALSPFAGVIVVAAEPCACAIGAVDRGLGQCATVLGHFDAAEVHFANALELEERVASPPLVARTKYWLAHMLRRRDDQTHAVALLLDVIDATHRLGMRQLEAEAHALVAATAGP